jgi:YD repeat-containing protein
VSYGYDAAGRRTAMTVGSDSSVAYGYDAADRLTSLTKGSQAVLLIYDDADRRTSVTLPNGITQSHSYDAASRVTAITYSKLQNLLGEIVYAYDPVGNRTRASGSFARTNLPARLTSASYDDANRLASWDGNALSYDENGNLTQDGLTGYGWNARRADLDERPGHARQLPLRRLRPPAREDGQRHRYRIPLRRRPGRAGADGSAGNAAPAVGEHAHRSRPP